MSSKSITIKVVVDAGIYRRFYMFEKFSRKHGLLKIIIFISVLSAFAALLLVRQEIILGVVLLFFGLGLPAYNIWNFFRTLELQIKAFDLEDPKEIYSLHFTDDPIGIEVTNHGGGEEPLRYEWDKLHGAYRFDECIYLYVLPNKAFLLPDGQSDADSDALWQLFSNMLPPKNIQDRRKKNK